MLKIYTITFHHAYNFGSMLQTYALQEFVKKIALEKNETVDYEIINLDEINLYGVGITTNNDEIGKNAPLFFRQTEDKYLNKYGAVKYGMITYDIEREESQKYYCLYDKKIEEFEHIKIPKSKWLRFRINSQNAKDIQDISHKFYGEFLPSVKYNLKELPELEYYHDGITDFLVAIY